MSEHGLRLDARDARPAAAAMLVAAAALPLLPEGAGILCPLRAVTGVPCPLCGMTTSVEATVHADLAGALAANPGGLVVVALAVLVLVRRGLVLRVPLIRAVLALAALWLFELQRYELL